MKITVYGIPAPQGSKRFMGTTKLGRGIMVESSDKVTPWRADVMTACRVAIRHVKAIQQQTMPPTWNPMEGPLIVRMVFTVPKPKSAPKRKRSWPVTRGSGDLSKLVRATEDALQAAGIISDDSCIVEYSRVAKVYPGEDNEALDIPGCYIEVTEKDF